MKLQAALLVVACVTLRASGMPVQGDDGPPAWAYVVIPPDFKTPPDDGTRRHVPGSSVTFRLSQLRDLFSAPDWHPGDHPPLPGVVARGRKPAVYACGFCHRADGPGGPENSSLAGLPSAYIVQQMQDFKSGARTPSVPQRMPGQAMVSVAKAVSPSEVAAAAAYFSSLQPRPVIRVVETNAVPKTYVAGWVLAAGANGATEPIGRRIIEVPEDLEQFEHRDTHSQFIAYVPTGSIKKGRTLAETGGGGRTIRCGLCHGPALKGFLSVPGIAGRSPSYTIRQLYDFKHGARNGKGSVRMKPSVGKLTLDDMIALAAYLASLTP